MTKSRDHLVLRICTAYEQGVGHARRDELENPYVPGSPEFEAWFIGREWGIDNLYHVSETTAQAGVVMPSKEAFAETIL